MRCLLPTSFRFHPKLFLAATWLLLRPSACLPSVPCTGEAAFFYYAEGCSDSVTNAVNSGYCDNGVKVNDTINYYPCADYDEGGQYCHECDAGGGSIKTVCSSDSDTDVVCAHALTEPPTCVDGGDGVAYTNSCEDAERFVFTSESCEDGTYYQWKEVTSCAEVNNYDGHHYCNTCGGISVCADSGASCEGLGLPSPNGGELLKRVNVYAAGLAAAIIFLLW